MNFREFLNEYHKEHIGMNEPSPELYSKEQRNKINNYKCSIEVDSEYKAEGIQQHLLDNLKIKTNYKKVGKKYIFEFTWKTSESEVDSEAIRMVKFFKVTLKYKA